MEHARITLLVVLMGSPRCLGQVLQAPAGHNEPDAPVCETFFTGPADGDWTRAEYWTPIVPDPRIVACKPGSRAQSVRDVGDRDVSAPTSRTSPATIGACCLSSTCLITDAFDCLIQRGFFSPNVVFCSDAVCGTGVCCTNDPACEDNNGTMDESLCTTIGGDYIGGALCDVTDPCQRFRIPDGFEIVETALGTLTRYKRGPQMNNCGEIVFQVGAETTVWGPEAEIYRYDNGLLKKVTDNNWPDVVPDISDTGTIVWSVATGSWFERETAILRDGEVLLPAPESVPGDAHSINNLDHAVWDVDDLDACPEGQTGGFYRVAIHILDQGGPHLLYEDAVLNQIPKINEMDEVTWFRMIVDCGAACCDWIGSIPLYRNGTVMFMPITFQNPTQPDLDNNGRVIWSLISDGVQLWDNGLLTRIIDYKGCCPSLNDTGDIIYAQWMDPFWAVWLIRDGTRHHISNPGDRDLDVHIDNAVPDSNDAGEIAWQWYDNPWFTQIGIKYMQRIRDGDVNFDGVVDVADFLPMPGCYTGPIATDRLCQCRFFDMDHDRDVDLDDLSLFLRVYTGPVGDCNGDGVSDLEQLLVGGASDCNLNAVPDACELVSNPALDLDGDGVLDACCAPAMPIESTLGPRNRYLTLKTGVSDPARIPGLGDRGQPVPIVRPRQAIRVTILDMPPDTPTTPDTATTPNTPTAATAIAPRTVEPASLPVGMNRELRIANSAMSSSPQTVEPASLPVGDKVFSDSSAAAPLVGRSFWVGPPVTICENSGQGFGDPIETCGVAPGQSSVTMVTAPLQCDPFFTDWLDLGEINIRSDMIVPGATYTVELINEGCALSTPGNYSPPLTIVNADFGDVVSDCTTLPCGPPDGTVNVTTDVTSVLDKFSNLARAPAKARCDLEPSTPDGKIGISDVTLVLDAFGSKPYPFTPSPPPCP